MGAAALLVLVVDTAKLGAETRVTDVGSRRWKVEPAEGSAAKTKLCRTVRVSHTLRRERMQRRGIGAGT